MLETILIALLVFFCRVTDVALGTMRMLYLVHGEKYIAGIIGFFEVSIFLWAISSVINDTGNLPIFFAYGLGFAAGTIVGISVEEWLAPGNLSVTVISLKKYKEIADELRVKGFGVTEMLGKGRDGMIEIVHSIILRKDFRSLLRTVQKIDPEAFVTSDKANFVRRGFLHRIKRK